MTLREEVARALHAHRTGIPAEPIDVDWAVGDALIRIVLARAAKVARLYMIAAGEDAYGERIATAIEALRDA